MLVHVQHGRHVLVPRLAVQRHGAHRPVGHGGADLGGVRRGNGRKKGCVAAGRQMTRPGTVCSQVWLMTRRVGGHKKEAWAGAAVV